MEWNFEMLEAPRARDLAARAAAESDMVVVAAHPTDELPETLQSWFWSWLPARSNRCGALVAVLTPDSRAKQEGQIESSVCSHLRKIAAVGHMKFFCSGAFRPVTGEELSLEQIIQYARQAQAAASAPFRRKGVPKGGINE
jgi:uncharacterized protein YciI